MSWATDADAAPNDRIMTNANVNVRGTGSLELALEIRVSQLPSRRRAGSRDPPLPCDLVIRHVGQDWMQGP